MRRKQTVVKRPLTRAGHNADSKALSTMHYRQHCGRAPARYATFAPPLGSAHRERGIGEQENLWS